MLDTSATQISPFVLSEVEGRATHATMAFWAYILRCADDRFYTGHTDDLERRMAQHETRGFCDFTARRRPVTLVWSETFSSRIEALEAERRIKGWTRAKKEALIAGDWVQLHELAVARGARASTSSLRLEVYPERLPWQAVEGLSTNGGGSATPLPINSLPQAGGE